MKLSEVKSRAHNLYYSMRVAGVSHQSALSAVADMIYNLLAEKGEVHRSIEDDEEQEEQDAD